MTELERRKQAGGSTSALANMGIMSPIMKIQRVMLLATTVSSSTWMFNLTVRDPLCLSLPVGNHMKSSIYKHSAIPASNKVLTSS